ncbi:uncharacterized protein PAE49_011008 isoform 2-T2 [Odontesthes bonariensis]|uniref:uncharacterized protein LOC142390813 isoform X2 n=1 Tax=Odontesthes bonariensis TaxID=219752 RepID=UPI003F589FD4
MMEGFSDLLTDAFSETSVPSFPDGDLDFENLSFDEKSEEDNKENIATTSDGALLQEATAEITALLGKAAQDILYTAENASEDQSNDESDEEDFKGVSLMSKTPEDGYTSSDGESEKEGSVSGEENEEEDVGSEEEAGDLLMSVRYSDGFHDSSKEDDIFAEGQPMAPEGADNPQDRNKVQGEAESDEEVAYFGGVPEHGNEMMMMMMMMKGAGTEDDKQEIEEGSSDSECEGMKIEQEENVHVQETENPYRDVTTKASLEFPSISSQNLQDLIAEVDGEEYVEKMTDFSGEEHQEAGECFADYPSDISSFEYTEDGGNNQENKSSASTCMRQNACLENAVTEVTWMGSVGDTDDEKEDGFLYSKDLEMNANEVMSLDVAPGERDEGKSEHLLAVRECDDGDETGGSDSYSSSDEEEPLRRTREELTESMRVNHLENDKQLEDIQFYGGSSAALSKWSISDDHHVTNDRANPANFINWDFDVLKTDTFLSDYLLEAEDTDKTETRPSDVNKCPAEDVNSYSEVQRKDTKMISLSNQGSLDDSFFFNAELEASGVSELGQLGDDEYEDERNWEQEQERIKAFYEFYDDSDDENRREGRQIRVQFCADPLSQVIRYETESDRDSLSSSTDREEDLSSTDTPDEMREPEDILQIQPAADPPNLQVPERLSDHSNTPTCTGTNKTLSMLKLTVKTGVVMGVGLLMFWLTTDQMDWLSQLFFF